MFKRMSVVPFETAIAIYAIVAGIAGFYHFGIVDPLAALIPTWEGEALNAATIASGAFMTAGIAGGSAKTEQAGLLFLDAILLCRFFLYGHFFHYGSNFIVMGSFIIAILIASIVRSLSVRKRHILLKVDGGKLFNELGDI